MNREDFFPRVWELVAEIPYGQVATYGQLAELLGYPRHARLVGAAMPATDAVLPTGPNSKFCWRRKALPFCPAARQILPIFAGRVYENWQNRAELAISLH